MSQRSLDEMLGLLQATDAKEIKVGPLSSTGLSTVSRAKARHEAVSRQGQWCAMSANAEIAVSREEAANLIGAGAKRVASVPLQRPMT